ncbi:SIR2 family NAD-dependent protein deacylase [Bergeyella sp. RCAD1439]|uniref:SIR2 family NAD-dependent protein deacylase n=1 Tax=Bergeyella anatis TaxID=3113737 RepID=UPI002E188433|nr:NAD-dependent deacylase [Bergeyella sp. RCAD1439]
MKKKLVVLSGAGISAESGIKTFRDYGGLWENHRIEDVASPEGFARNPSLVLDFYNLRRRQLKEVEPNEAHRILSALEDYYDVWIITQNVDDLHERAGSSRVLHLHGELLKVRPSGAEAPVMHWDQDLNLGDTDEKGRQLRPHIVWFGEVVPNIEEAAVWVSQADVFLVVGTSLQVYPAAGLVHEVPRNSKIYVIDPHLEEGILGRAHYFRCSATEGMKRLQEQLLSEFKH